MLEGLDVLFFWKNWYVIERNWKLHPNVEVCPFQLKIEIQFLIEMTLSLSEALLLFNEEVKTPHNKGEYRNPN